MTANALGAAFFGSAGPELLSGAGQMLLYMVELSLRLLPLLLGAIFLAELARLKLGEARLRRLLLGTGAWKGRLRAAALGSALPFCECGAFPVLLGLLKAGVPVGVTLTFFLISPVVSLPAFFMLLGFFGPLLALSYLGVTAGSALLGSLLLELSGRSIIKKDFVPADGNWGCVAAGSGADREEPASGLLKMQEAGGCCEEGTPVENEASQDSTGNAVLEAWNSTIATFKRVLPYVVAALVLASFMGTFIPPQMMERALSYGAPFDVLIAAAAGVPFYAGDCAMIAVVAPLITSTGAVGPGIAFIIAGAGTSINGLVFMGAVFTRRFLLLYVAAVFLIALLTGYILAAFV